MLRYNKCIECGVDTVQVMIEHFANPTVRRVVIINGKQIHTLIDFNIATGTVIT